MTGGQGRYTIALSHYDAVPPSVQAQLAAQFKVSDDD
jgi:elongation factor G